MPLSFLTPKFETHRVGGTEHKFYPVSVKQAFKLRVIGKGLTKALSVLFQSTAQDVVTKDKSITNKEGFLQREITVDAVSAEMAKFRAEQRAQSIEEAIDALMSEESIKILCELIFDSMRDDFGRDLQKWPSTDEFCEQVPAPEMLQLVWGVAKANKGVLGPLAEKATRLSSQFEAAVEKKIAAISPARVAPVVQTDPSTEKLPKEKVKASEEKRSEAAETVVQPGSRVVSMSAE